VNTRAFTLVEMIAAMTILSLVGGTAAMLLFQGAAAARGIQTGAFDHDRLSAACERIVRELRAIEPRPGPGARAPDIDAVETQALAWNTGSSLTLEGSDLVLRAGDDEARVLLRDVGEFRVHAYAESGAELAPPLQGSACDVVRRVSVTLGVTRNGRTDSLRATAFVRAMMAGGAS
jgi:prepilin-type N-terminal cleavage/methylation domain-containing protein